jgi:hypothetical protein
MGRTAGLRPTADAVLQQPYRVGRRRRKDATHGATWTSVLNGAPISGAPDGLAKALRAQQQRAQSVHRHCRRRLGPTAPGAVTGVGQVGSVQVGAVPVGAARMG